MILNRKLTTADLEAQAELERQKNGQEGQLEASQPKNGRRVKKLKKKRTWKFYVGVALVAIALAGMLAKAIAHKSEISDSIKKYFGNDDDTNKDEITAVADNLPFEDLNGVVNITFPLIDQTLGQTDGKYATISNYTVCDICGGSITISDLEKVGNNGNGVDYYQSNNEPIGQIGVLPKYAEFLDNMSKLKAKIIARDASVTAALEPTGYEVPDLYILPSGYVLYSETPEVLDEIKIAWKVDDATGKKDGRIMYEIPAHIIDKVIGISIKDYELITKFETLQSQIIQVYSQYDIANGPIEANNEETTNRGR